MKYIDSHTHTYLRGPEDLQSMAIAGVEGVVICSYFPIRPGGSSTLIDLFYWLQDEMGRLANYGITSQMAVGIHPRSIPKIEVDEVMDQILNLFDHGLAAALGEVGLETGSAEEREVLAKQLRIANDYGRPMIIHTPQNNKAEIVEATLGILKEEKIDASMVVLDHLTPELVAKVKDEGAIAGLTLQPGKMTYKDVEAAISKTGPERIVLNSDLGNKPSDPLALPKAAFHMDRDGISGRDIELVTYSNIRALMWFR